MDIVDRLASALECLPGPGNSPVSYASSNVIMAKGLSRRPRDRKKVGRRAQKLQNNLPTPTTVDRDGLQGATVQASARDRAQVER
jgi:hypothetical protein